MQRLTVLRAIVAAWSIAGVVTADQSVDFNRDIRSLFSENCLECHGPDAENRQSDLRLDERSSVFADRDDPLIVPGDVQASELFRRVASDDPDYRMPPPDYDKRLTKAQVDQIARWIQAGGKWDEHWAFQAPKRPAIPEIQNKEFARNPIDYFVVRTLDAHGLRPAKEAAGTTLLRRLHSDLLGLPPTDIANLPNLTEAKAYESWVDRLLESSHFGERMAIYWLDVVRYADSNGYHSDEPRTVAPYRDYVIESFNVNRPFDEFVVEQLAGDLLPAASMRQKIASGFNMLLPTTNEGGAQAKEYLAKYMADRVRNTSTIFLGVTMGCAECHDHKFDPFTMKDFYSLGAFFADIKQKGVGNPPTYRAWTPRQGVELAKIDQQIEELQQQLETETPELNVSREKWESSVTSLAEAKLVVEPWYSLGPIKEGNFDRAFEFPYGAEEEINLSKPVASVSWRRSDEYEDGKVHSFQPGGQGAYYLFRRIHASRSMTAELSLAAQDAVGVWVNGGQVFEDRSQGPPVADEHKLFVHLQEGENRLLIKVAAVEKEAGFYFHVAAKPFPDILADPLAIAASERTNEQRESIRNHYLSIAPELASVRRELAAARRARYRFYYLLPTTLMTVSTEPQTTRILPRGNWLDESGPEVVPGVPGILKGLEIGERRATRLDFANWIVDAENPLTARVFVNRLWKLFFGRGLSNPLDDLGARGTTPTHPELLDWLAVEFRESGWNIKHIVRLMVMSGTYRQTSQVTAELRNLDPYNEFYARQSRFRLDAEMVRDNALAVSGLLVRKIGGRSVKPYQPAGYWRHMNFPARQWEQDQGEHLYRRSLYTWWQRMFLHPAMVAFDAPSREECTVERPRSNTPQQALVLLNDPTYVEAARVFAEQVLQHGGDRFDDRLNWAFRKALSRDVKPHELDAMREVFEKHRKGYQEDHQAAQKLVTIGSRPIADDREVAELAAWTSLMRILLNLHESITRL